MMYKFVKEPIPLTELHNTPEYQLYKKLIREQQKATRHDKDELFRYLFPAHTQYIKRGGWALHFDNILHEYWVQFTHGDIFSYYACDKSSIRNM